MIIVRHYVDCILDDFQTNIFRRDSNNGK